MPPCSTWPGSLVTLGDQPTFRSRTTRSPQPEESDRRLHREPWRSCRASVGWGLWEALERTTVSTFARRANLPHSASLIPAPNQQQHPELPVPQEGRFAVVTNVGCGMRWTLWRRADERCLRRTAKSCGPDAPKLASSWRKSFCWRQWQESPVTGESAKETVNHRAGKAGVFSGFTCGPTPVLFVARDPWVQSAPGFPSEFRRRKVLAKLA